jgi:hypothetical protein
MEDNSAPTLWDYDERRTERKNKDDAKECASHYVALMAARARTGYMGSPHDLFVTARLTSIGWGT